MHLAAKAPEAWPKQRGAIGADEAVSSAGTGHRKHFTGEEFACELGRALASEVLSGGEQAFGERGHGGTGLSRGWDTLIITGLLSVAAGGSKELWFGGSGEPRRREI